MEVRTIMVVQLLKHAKEPNVIRTMVLGVKVLNIAMVVTVVKTIMEVKVMVLNIVMEQHAIRIMELKVKMPQHVKVVTVDRLIMKV